MAHGLRSKTIMIDTPVNISDELACFLGEENGTKIARTKVSLYITEYIKWHKLQDKENPKKINPDNKLAVLLNLNDTDELTYFNIQDYLSPHFHTQPTKISYI